MDQVSGGVSLTQQSLGQILYPLTFAETAGGVAPSNYSYFAQPWLWVRREGCALDGTTDDSAAFNKCLAVAATTNMALLIDGPCYLNDDIVIPQNVQLVFVGNGTLKPGSGETVTLGQIPQAGLWQIFDLSLGGLIAIPGTGNRFSEVWAEWWGANGDAVTRLNNDVPINAALSCLNASGAGGVVRLGTGTFFTSAVINIFHETRIEGVNGFTLIKAQSGWTGGTQMINASRAGNLAMFWSRISNVRIDANAINGITQVVYARGWQEKCGLLNVQITNFITDGFYYEHGDGGAAHMQLNNLELYPSDVPNARGAYITNDATAGYLKLEINQLTVVENNPWSGNGTIAATTLTINSTASGVVSIGQQIFGVGVSPNTLISAGSGTSWTVGPSQNVGPIAMTGIQNTTGIQLDNHILCTAMGIDIESIRYGITLSNSTAVGVGSILVGAGISGGGSVQTMINCAASWTGQIDLAGAKIGNAAVLLTDSNRSYAIAAIESSDARLVWPPQMNRAVGTAYITGGDTPVLAASQGVVGSVAHGSGAGIQRITLGTSMDGTTKMLATVSSFDTGAPQAQALMIDATHLDIYTFSKLGAAIASAALFVEIFHAP